MDSEESAIEEVKNLKQEWLNHFYYKVKTKFKTLPNTKQDK